jgi:DNA repair protein RadC
VKKRLSRKPHLGHEPSKQDIAMTKTIYQAIQAIDARLHDHLIISGESHFSFKNSGLL